MRIGCEQWFAKCELVTVKMTNNFIICELVTVNNDLLNVNSLPRAIIYKMLTDYCEQCFTMN